MDCKKSRAVNNDKKSHTYNLRRVETQNKYKKNDSYQYSFYTGRERERKKNNKNILTMVINKMFRF